MLLTLLPWLARLLTLADYSGLWCAHASTSYQWLYSCYYGYLRRCVNPTAMHDPLQWLVTSSGTIACGACMATWLLYMTTLLTYGPRLLLPVSSHLLTLRLQGTQRTSYPKHRWQTRAMGSGSSTNPMWNMEAYPRLPCG